MHKTIDAIFEKGVLRPVERLPRTESQKIKITVDTAEGIVTSTKAMIKASPALVQEVAENDEYLYDS